MPQNALRQPAKKMLEVGQKYQEKAYDKLAN